MAALRRRRIGTTNVEVSELGLGCSGIAGLFSAVPDATARATVTAALDAGICYCDAAPFYGFGRAEHMLGDAVRDRRHDVVVSTKVGRLLAPYRGPERHRDGWFNPFPFEPVFDYSYDGIMRSYEDSRQRLGFGDVDILLVHDIGMMTHGDVNDRHWRALASGGYRALQELRSTGQVKAIGIGVNEWQVLKQALEIGDWDVFLLAGRYTLLEQTPLRTLLDDCLARGVSVIAAAPFNGGALMGTGKWNYADAPAEIIQLVERLRTFCEQHAVPIGAAALQFPLAHPAIGSVLPGPRSPAEVTSVVDWFNLDIPDTFWSDLAGSGLLTSGAPLPSGFASR